MKIYNSLTREKEEFVPIKPGKVGMYVCGPTVYDEPHIGHARSAYIFDVIRRYLRYKGYKVTFVRNVTDVDDKIIEKARKEFGVGCKELGVGLQEKVKEVSKKYLDAYHEDMELLGIGRPDKEPRATEYIPKMIKFIGQLIKNGCAYEADGNVYFNIKSAKDYGKLSNQNLKKMEIGSRIASGENKKDPLDFALWKKAKEDEPSWKSPWGPGRPGWHIECSVMSSDILGDQFDIHGGGIDLIFPHHENEIAQSEGAGNKFANLWIHNGLLTIKGEKMAKSLGNFVTIKQFGKSFDLLKLLFLSAHYRHPVDYTEEKINEMCEKRDRILAFLQKVDTASQGYTRPEIKNNSYFDNFIAAMDDDFNTPSALSVIFKCVTDGNKTLENNQPGEADLEKLRDIRFFIRNISKDVFGLSFDYQAHDNAIEAMIFEREKAKKNKDFKKADTIRKELLGRGIIIEDKKYGPPVWRNKN